MLIKKNHFVFTFFASAAFLLLSCSHLENSGQSARQNDGEKTSSIKVLNWNLQTFFDANFDGTEYSQFKNSSAGWSKEKYEERLERLAKVVKSSDPDVLVVQELENAGQLYDIFNRLCSNFNLRKNYSYGCFAKEKGSSIGTAVLSRYPLSSPAVHSLDIRTEPEKMPSMRPLLKVFVTVKEKTLLLMVNHWKSKSGGEEKTEVWRNYQENALAFCFASAAQKGQCAIACGDFNRDVSEFKKMNEENANIELRGQNPAFVYSPWFDEQNELYEPGSYFYKNEWGRIDHFFAGKGVKISHFAVENDGDWAREDGSPFKYVVRYGSGYSDHFPISCVVSW